MVFSLILKTFQQPLTNWSNDMQQQQLVYFFMLRSAVAWTEVRCHEDIQTFYCYVPVSGPDTSYIRQCDVGNIPHKNTHFTDIYGVL